MTLRCTPLPPCYRAAATTAATHLHRHRCRRAATTTAALPLLPSPCFHLCCGADATPTCHDYLIVA
jgi:hypothetical protein